ncbi:SDR family oxidoreductase [Streptomyces arboris]|uniref:SDR family oxidoreductase n=1 Tax=Streptomyces arboris TaxID=2600619 RepID=UPI00363840DD
MTPCAVEAALTGEAAGAPGGSVGLLFADAVPTARPLLPYVEDGGAVVLTAPTPCPDAVRALAAELASRGVRVNAVAPGCIEAPGSGAVPLPPLGRLGATEEVARAALFLATEATFTTGARLPVDGGLGRT